MPFNERRFLHAKNIVRSNLDYYTQFHEKIQGHLEHKIGRGATRNTQAKTLAPTEESRAKLAPTEDGVGIENPSYKKNPRHPRFRTAPRIVA